jgi:hypothetical protein
MDGCALDIPVIPKRAKKNYQYLSLRHTPLSLECSRGRIHSLAITISYIPLALRCIPSRSAELDDPLMRWWSSGRCYRWIFVSRFGYMRRCYSPGVGRVVTERNEWRRRIDGARSVVCLFLSVVLSFERGRRGITRKISFGPLE